MPDSTAAENSNNTVDTASPPLEKELDPEFEHSMTWFRRWWPILLIGTALTTIIIKQIAPLEIAKFYVTQALERRLQGDLIGSLQSLTHAMKCDPASKSYFLEQLVRQSELRVQRDPLRPELYSLRGFDRQMAGDRVAALADTEGAVRLAKLSYGHALNSLAYLLALNGEKLDLAVKYVDQSIELVGEDPSLIDTRGFIRYRRKEYQSARLDLDRAVEQTEQLYQEALQGNIVPNILSRRSQLVVLLYHRAKIFDALELKEEAQKDYQRIREFKIEPSDDLF